MNIAFYILTYNRPTVLKHCLESLYGNTTINPQESWIIDDGSSEEVQQALFSTAKSHNINLILGAKNQGIGYSFERLYNLIWQNDDLDIACIIESDYVFRRGWLEDALAVFESSPHTLAIAGTDHPDMYSQEKTLGLFPKMMEEHFGSDVEARDLLYKPFSIPTSRGEIKVQGVSNSCGCMILHWGRFKKIVSFLEEKGQIERYDYKKTMDKAFHKGIKHDTRLHASDGHMSNVIAKYGDEYLKLNNIPHDGNFPFLSICDFSIAEHLAGGGVNGGIVPEGYRFMFSPTWKDEYLKKDPREKF